MIVTYLEKKYCVNKAASPHNNAGGKGGRTGSLTTEKLR